MGGVKPTMDEITVIRTYAEKGWSVARIARKMRRSAAYVGAVVRGQHYMTEGMGVAPGYHGRTYTGAEKGATTTETTTTVCEETYTPSTHRTKSIVINDVINSNLTKATKLALIEKML